MTNDRPPENPMTDIAALRELLASASPGPWEHVRVRPMQHEVFTADDGVCVEGGAAISTWHAADARLIAAAVNALPVLCDAIDRIRDELMCTRLDVAGDDDPSTFARHVFALRIALDETIDARDAALSDVTRWKREAEIASQDETTMRGVLRAEHQECQRLRGEVDGLRREVHECDTFHGNVKSQLDVLRRQATAADNDRDAAIAEASRLKALVVEACDLAEEGWEYAADYFNQKWEPRPRLAAIRAEAERSGT